MKQINLTCVHISDFLIQCGVLFLIAFVQRGLWLLRIWLLSKRTYSSPATNKGIQNTDRSPGGKTKEQVFELNNAAAPKQVTQHKSIKRQLLVA